MKKLVIMILCSLILLTGCKNRFYDVDTKAITLEIVEKNTVCQIYIYRDVDTDVLYISRGYGPSPILNADGTPKLYSQVYK